MYGAICGRELNGNKYTRQEGQMSRKCKSALHKFFVNEDRIPTLQTDQMNVIAHHIHSIRMQQDLWPEKDKTKWP